MNSAYEKLCNCLDKITDGPWRFIQLRGVPLSPACFDNDDVDLLGNRESVISLLDAVYTWVRNGECHARIVARNAFKFKLYLFSIDGVHYLDLDLWIELRQLFKRTCVLLPDPSLALATPQSPSIYRAPPPLELAIYIQHVIAKRRDAHLPERARTRLAEYRAKTEDAALASLLDEALSRNRITPGLAEFSDSCLKNFPTLFSKTRPTPLSTRFRDFSLAPPRRPSWIALMGGDGTGKTSLAKALLTNLSALSPKLYTGKHLYRKNLLYKLLTIFVRPFLRQPREKFDETIAPLVYLLAVARLRLALWLARSYRCVLVDRSPVDFLMQNRKSDFPTFGTNERLSNWWGCRIPTVHLLVDYQQLAQRKNEMTAQGIATYDQEMYRHFTRYIPTDYTLFNNSGTLEESAGSLARIIKRTFNKR